MSTRTITVPFDVGDRVMQRSTGAVFIIDYWAAFNDGAIRFEGDDDGYSITAWSDDLVEDR